MSDSDQADALLAKTARGAGWVVSWRFATRLLGLANTLTLVHLLAPADFGLVALGTSFSLAIDQLSILGVDEVVIREKSPSREIYDTAFTMQAIRGLGTALIIAGLSRPVAAFFGDARLAHVLLALAGAALADGLMNIGIVDFRRSFAFDKEFRLLLLPRLASIAATIGFALIWRNYWALVAGILVNRTLRLVASYAMHPHRPRPTLRAWRMMVGFSVWTWLTSLVELARDRSATLLVGRLLGAAQVGIFAIGAEVAALPTTELVEPLCRAAYSAFAQARHEALDVADTYLRVLATTFLITLPAGFGISLVADPLIRLAFGRGWLAAILPLEILSASGTLMVFGLLSQTLYTAHAILRPNFRIVAASTLVRVALLILLTRSDGLTGAAVAVMLAAGVEQGLYVAGIFRRFGLGPGRLLRQVWRSLLATAAMAAALIGCGLGWTAQDGTVPQLAARLAVAATAGAAIYVAVLAGSWAASGRPKAAEADALAVIRRLFGRLRGVVRRGRGASDAAGPG